MEEQNQLLRRQLSFSQTQLMSAMSDGHHNDTPVNVQDNTYAAYGGGGTEDRTTKCASKVRGFLCM
jgi:hypothetical protein